jgi:hypothetical protein
LIILKIVEQNYFLALLKIKIQKKVILNQKRNLVSTQKNSPNINYNEVDALLKEDDIKVAQEELLSVKNIKVIDLDTHSKTRYINRSISWSDKCRLSKFIFCRVFGKHL